MSQTKEISCVDPGSETAEVYCIYIQSVCRWKCLVQIQGLRLRNNLVLIHGLRQWKCQGSIQGLRRLGVLCRFRICVGGVSCVDTGSETAEVSCVDAGSEKVEVTCIT